MFFGKLILNPVSHCRPDPIRGRALRSNSQPVFSTTASRLALTVEKPVTAEGNNPQTGQYVFTDFNGDGKITSPDDRQIIENIGIRYFGGWNNQLKYKNWNMSFLFQFVKQKARNYNAVMPIPGSLNNLPVEALNVWSPSNPGGFYMPYVSGSNPSHTLLQNSDAAYSDASFIRLKNIQLSYKIPVGDKTVFRDARIFVQGQNLLTVTNYFGIDPETGSGSFLPPLKTYSFGVQLGF